jgi:teichuronic acid biosynthesis glycosyltransferase TuaC
MISSLSPSGEGFVQPAKSLHLLTLTPFYPVAEDDARGCFIAESLPWLEQLGVVNTVIAVQPFYRKRARASDSAAPARCRHFLSLPGGLGLPSAGVFLFAHLLAEVRSLHKTNPIDVIHAHSALPCGHAATFLSRELRIPFVVTVHGLDAYSTNQVGGYAGGWCKRVSQLVYRSACRVVCVSEKVREQVTGGGLDPTRTSVVYNGVDPQIFAPPTRASANTIILSVGNLIQIKGHELLMRALAAVNQSSREFSWEVIGSGSEQPRLEMLARELGLEKRVRFIGRQNRSEVANAMRRCTIFALPSRYEGLGCVYLEAMSAAKPVIACRGQGIEEVIEQGLNGCLVDPDDLEELTDTISVLMQREQLRRDMGNAARRTILKGYTLAYQAARLARLFRECAT